MSKDTQHQSNQEVAKPQEQEVRPEEEQKDQPEQAQDQPEESSPETDEVTVLLPRIADETIRVVPVNINGEKTEVPVGVETKVSRAVAQVLCDSYRRDVVVKD